MAAIGGLVGLGGGAAGTSFQGPQAAPIVDPTNLGQINQAYSGVQTGLTSQQNLLNALNAQNGIKNQGQVYGQLQDIASGKGPNPAQAMLNQQTGQNVANQAALMAGQRGSGANAGLIARQAAEQGAATQQQAVGQGATMQAQQSLNALGEAGQLANTQAANQIGQTNANTQAQMAEQSALLGAQQGYNSNQVSSQNSINAANAGLAQTQMQGQQGLIGSALGAVGLGASAAKAEGGEVKMLAAGGDAFSGNKAQSRFGQFLMNQSQPAAAENISPEFSQGVSSVTGGLGGSRNKKVPTKAATNAVAPTMAGGPDAGDLGNQDTLLAALGGTADYRRGGKVIAKDPAQKAVARGNNYANDKIPAVLSEHEIVIPRSITMNPNAAKRAAQFVAKEIAKRKVKHG